MKLFPVILILVLLSSCKSKTVYVPVESVRTEYKDRYQIDSVYVHDSTTLIVKGDSVFLERIKFKDKYVFLHDSVYFTDSIAVPYPVEVPGPEVNRITGFQNFQIWCGRVCFLFIFLFLGYNKIKSYFKP